MTATLSPPRHVPVTPGVRRLTRGLVLAGLAACALGLIALALPPGAIRLVLLTAFLVVGPGAAIVCHVPLRNALVAAALTVTAGFAASGLVTAGAYWADSWHPLFLHLAMVVAGTASLLARLALPDRHPVDVLPAAETPARGVREIGRRARLFAVATPALLVTAVALWVWSLLITDPYAVGDFGLTVGLGVPFVAAVALVCAAFALELRTTARTGMLVAALAAFLLLSRATSPLLLEFPQYSWTFKHFGVVELINQTGRLTDPTDIYQQWPAFFTTVAQLSGVAGVAPITFGSWSPLFFGALDLLVLAALVRTITGKPRVLFLAVFLFSASAWPETNYFSPQAMAFVLALGLYLIVFLWLRRTPPPDRFAALVRGAPRIPGSDRPVSRWTVLAACLVFLVITATHQLSPFLMLAPLVVATVLRLIRPRYLVVVLLAIAMVYALPRLGDLTGQYSIFSGWNLFANGAGNAPNAWATPGQAFSAAAARATCFGLWGAALVAAYLRRRHLGSVLLPLVLAFAPFGLMLVTNYGGEIVYRVYIFSIPMCALLVASMWIRRTGAGVRAIAASVLVLTLACLASMQGVQGQFKLDRVPASEITAAEYLYANAQPGSAVLLAARNFPTRLTADYDSFNIGVGNDPALLDEKHFRDIDLGPAVLPEVTGWARRQDGTQRYLVVSEPMEHYAHYFGVSPDGSLADLASALRSSPEWSVFYDDGSTRIFQLTR